MLEALNTSITVGNISVWSRPTRSAVSVSSRFETSKRRASARSRTNARTTRIPLICSRSTRLTVSIRGCIARNCGTIREMISPTLPASTGTAITRSRESVRSSRSAITIPPMHMIGADTSIVVPISTSICTCCTSLVVRVMSDGAPNRPTSRAENSPTCAKIAPRRSRPYAIAARAP